MVKNIKFKITAVYLCALLSLILAAKISTLTIVLFCLVSVIGILLINILINKFQKSFYIEPQKPSMKNNLKNLDNSYINKSKIELITKLITEPLVILTNNYKIIFVNSQFEDLFNLKLVDIINKEFLETIKNIELFEFIKDSNENKHVSERICLNIPHKDTSYYYTASFSKTKMNNSNTDIILVKLIDINSFKQLEKIKTDFVATVTHELEIPIQSLKDNINLIKKKNFYNNSEHQFKTISALHEDCERLSSLTNELFEITKIDSSKSVFKIQPCSLDVIIENSIDNLSDVAKQRQVKLYYDIDQLLPKVLTDYKKTTWILNNLISNALKNTNAGDEIFVSAYVKHDKVCILVKDTGIGIPKEYQNKIFDTFFLLKNYDLEIRGSGLSLSIAKEILSSLGGEIWCESELDSGSTFTFTLPISKKA